MPPGIGDKGQRMRGHRVDARTRTLSTQVSSVKAPCPAPSVSEQALRSLPAFLSSSGLESDCVHPRGRASQFPRAHGAHAPFASSPRGLTGGDDLLRLRDIVQADHSAHLRKTGEMIAAMRSRRCAFAQAQRWANACVVTGSLLTVTTLYHRTAPRQRWLFAA